ncbi:MAG: endonuclease/exonuclease/phosphatase family protein [Bacteroidales bacterium]|nr:endonuclease/exonuclease/phosphatase family protein [Bacteroidales bacterium]MBO4567031.1 endonuclease/exonuclease/phosphatase family protein [Bacteroidales bacterium]
MKRLFYPLVLIILMAVACGPARNTSGTGTRSSHIIGFYNLENLFDTFHDEGKNDYEYLPDGANEWTEAKYQKKLANMAHVIAAMKEDNGVWHTVLGVSEIENRHVLEDLVVEPEIAAANYQIVHYDGPDRRGVDVAMLYDPTKFTLLDSESIPFTFAPSEIKFDMTPEEQENFRTRDILMCHGLIGGEHFAIYVCHLPSRLGGKGADNRARGGEIVYNHARGMMEKYPGIKCVIMGDMNDNPTDPSMAYFMHGRETREEMAPEDFFSPFLSMLKAGYSSLYYRGESNIYDCILVSNSLANAPEGSWQIQPIIKGKYYGRIFSKPFMTNQSGQYKGTPFRTFSNGAFVGGYSDHYPTYIVIAR